MNLHNAFYFSTVQIFKYLRRPFENFVGCNFNLDSLTDLGDYKAAHRKVD